MSFNEILTGLDERGINIPYTGIAACAVMYFDEIDEYVTFFKNRIDETILDNHIVAMYELCEQKLDKELALTLMTRRLYIRNLSRICHVIFGDVEADDYDQEFSDRVGFRCKDCDTAYFALAYGGPDDLRWCVVDNANITDGILSSSSEGNYRDIVSEVNRITILESVTCDYSRMSEFQLKHMESDGWASHPSSYFAGRRNEMESRIKNNEMESIRSVDILMKQFENVCGSNFSSWFKETFPGRTYESVAAECLSASS